MTNGEKVCSWWSNTFNAGAIFGAGFNAAMAQIKNTPAEWGQGFEGYSKRFGARIAQSTTKSTARLAFGVLFNEDPRRVGSRKKGFFPRAAHAFAHGTFVTRSDDGGSQFAAGRLAGAFSSGFVGLAWTPYSDNEVKRALVRTGTSFGGDLTSSFVTEFKCELTTFAKSLFKGRFSFRCAEGD
jgi:hypothetical protein